MHNKILKKLVLFAIDAILVLISFLLALGLAGRENSAVHYRWFEYLWMMGTVVGINLFIYARAGLYNEIIRFASMDFAVKVMRVTIFASLISVGVLHQIRREIDLSVLIVNWMASCMLIGASRFGYRYVLEGRLNKVAGRNTLLYGAGEHGAAVARHIMLNPDLDHKLVGFIDDSFEKRGKKIQGIPVLGTLDRLGELIKEYEVTDVVVSFSNPDGDLIKRIFGICRAGGVRCRIVPGMTDVIAGNEYVRNIDLADLMRRPQRRLDKHMIEDVLRGKRVMITGAAGSIGSEIFRQVLSYEPEALAALDHSEFNLYNLDEELSSHPLKSRCFFSLVDVKFPKLVNDAIASFKPDIIFHAAAYKHVPILEQDVRQAVLNNVLGIKNVIESAERHNVKRFILISTDKAVKPTNVMGATKRISELLVQDIASRGKMKCMGVRFGNVLASSGSVVPKFIAQIKAGGPVTVTHPEVTRYFMLIPEAVELVLQAGSMGNSGEIFVLDMGRPVKIAEMAENLIALMGYVPHTGIPIKYTGLRPGEKLYEELFLDEIERTTEFKDINIGKVKKVDEKIFSTDLRELLALAEEDSDAEKLRSAIKKLVPEYSETKN